LKTSKGISMSWIRITMFTHICYYEYCLIWFVLLNLFSSQTPFWITTSTISPINQSYSQTESG
jgi:hypothetical protein